MPSSVKAAASRHILRGAVRGDDPEISFPGYEESLAGRGFHVASGGSSTGPVRVTPYEATARGDGAHPRGRELAWLACGIARLIAQHQSINGRSAHSLHAPTSAQSTEILCEYRS